MALIPLKDIGSLLWRGEGIPPNTLGVDGDSFQDIFSFQYYDKIAGVWILRGATPIIISGTVTVLQGTTPWVVSGTVASTQSGTWNINNISGTISLPTGASTLAAQNTGNASLSSIDGKLNNNYGVSSGALRTASQIGNTTGAAAFNAGTTTAQTLRVVLPTDQTVIPVSQSGTWTTGRTWTLSSGTDSVSAVQSGTWNINNISGTISLPTGASTSAAQTDGSQKTQVVDGSGNVWGPRTNSSSVNWMPVINLEAATTGSAVASRTIQIGGSDGTNLRTLSTDTSGKLNVVVSNLPATVDTNYGAVGTSTVRTASQIGNVTGAADFNTGATGAQTLRSSSNLSDGSGNAITSSLGTSKRALNIINTPTGLNYYSVRINIRHTASTASGAMVWSVFNPSGSAKVVYIEDIAINCMFDTTSVSNATIRHSVIRYSGGPPTGGTAITVNPMDTSNATSVVTDARFLDTGLTTTGITNLTTLMNIGAVQEKGSVALFESQQIAFVLNANEGIAIITSTTAAAGAVLLGNVIWSER